MPDQPVVVVTGGTGLLGSVMVKRFLELGYRVVVPSRSEERLADLRKRTSASSSLEAIPLDLSSPGASGELLNQLTERSAMPEVLVNNARDAENLKLDEHGYPSRESWLAEYLLDVVVPCELTSVLAAASATRLRSVVNISSMYGVVAPTPRLYEDFRTDSAINYGVAKAALIHLTKELAIRLAPRVRVNSISYGGVTSRESPAFEARYAELAPLGRMLDENDVAGPVAFLASEESSGMTGHNVVVDGGWTAW